MSAYQCTPEHIATLCAIYGALAPLHPLSLDRRLHLGKLFALLATANAVSVNHRYPDKEQAPPVTWTRAFPAVSPEMVDANIGAIFKSIECLDYQCCEVDGWAGSEAHKVLAALREVLVTRLPGYESGVWGCPILKPVPT